MNYLKSLPTKNTQGVTVLAMDERTKENRAIKAGSCALESATRDQVT